MDYEKYKCEVCGRNFEPGDDIVVCPVCGTPQHRSCWQQTGHCVNEDKHAQGFEWKTPAVPEAPHADTRDSVCPYCGAINAPGTDICTECGAHLSVSPAPDQDSGAPGQDRDVPGGSIFPGLAAPVNDGGYEQVLEGEIDGIPSKEYAAYVGEGAARYVRSFNYFSKSGKKAGFNWAAMLFAPIWFFFRKMKKIGLIIIALQVVITMIFGFVSLDGPTKTYYGQIYNAVKQLAAGEVNTTDLERMLTEYADDYAESESSEHNNYTTKLEYVEYFCLVAINVLTGVFGDYIYMRKARRDILAARPKCTSMPQYFALLRSTGGISPGMGVLCAVIAGIALYVASLLPILSAVL